MESEREKFPVGQVEGIKSISVIESTLTGSDVIDDVERYTSEVESISTGKPVHSTSHLTGEGLNELGTYFGNHGCGGTARILRCSKVNLGQRIGWI